MSRIRGLELLFNLEKKHFRSKEDCLVAAIHCLCVNESLQCAGIGDRWPPDSDISTTELLPRNWNDDPDVYSLRYISKDTSSRFLLKVTKMDPMLHVDIAMNENAVASMSAKVENYVSDDYSDDYSTAYKSLDSLAESFRKNIMRRLHVEARPKRSSSQTRRDNPSQSISSPTLPARPRASLEREKEPSPSRFPRIGGSDLDPTGAGQGGMFLDPSNMGIPLRPTLPQFGVGGPGGFLPRGAVPPGARFDPIAPPNVRPSNPHPDVLKPPDYDDSL